MENLEQKFLLQINVHKGIIHKISKMYMNTSIDQEDLYQDIILQLWKAYPSFKGQSLFSTWMYRVALNTALLFLKRDARKVDKERLKHNFDTADLVETDNKEEKLSFFYNAVQELNPIEKALVFLFLENQTHKEIAYNLGISEVNARVKLNRTKEKLQNIIKKNGYEF